MNIRCFILPVVFSLLIGGNLFFVGSCKTALSNQVFVTTPEQEKPKTAAPVSDDVRKWIAPTYLGLKLGVSTEKDARELFGDPDSTYQNQDEDEVFLEDKESETVLEYTKSTKVNGGIVIIVGKTTQVIKGISIYPNDLTMQDAVSKFGNDFFQKDTYRPHCVDEKQKQGVFDDKQTYPFLLVYPNSGMLLDIRKFDSGVKVSRIDYLMKCR